MLLLTNDIVSFRAAPFLRQYQSCSMRDKGRWDFYKIIFFLCQPEYSLAADRCHNATPVNSAEQYYIEHRRLQNAKLLSLHSRPSLSAPAAASSGKWNHWYRLSAMLCSPASPIPTPGTRPFFSEPTPDTVSILVIHETNTSLHSSGLSRQPSLKGREPTSHWSLGPWAEPKPATESFQLTASLGTSDSRLCPHTGVSENVRLGI